MYIHVVLTRYQVYRYRPDLVYAQTDVFLCCLNSHKFLTMMFKLKYSYLSLLVFYILNRIFHIGDKISNLGKYLSFHIRYIILVCQISYIYRTK